LFSLATPLTQRAFAQEGLETIVRVEPQTSLAFVNETFTINVTVTGVQNLYGIDMTLDWNSSILTVINLNVRLGEVDGVLLNPISIVENTSQRGKYLLAGMSLPPAPSFNGSGNIARITFNVTNEGNSKLDLEAELYDYPPPDRDPRISMSIDHTTVDGVFNIVVPEFPNIAILMILMALMVLAVAFSKINRTTHSRTCPSTHQKLIITRKSY
jgi:hypothetical protein